MLLDVIGGHKLKGHSIVIAKRSPFCNGYFNHQNGVLVFLFLGNLIDLNNISTIHLTL